MLVDLGIILGKIGVVLMGILNGAGLLTWVERKQGALISDRIGANRASILGIRMWGLINSLADAMKLAFKEDYRPPHGLRFLHAAAPAFAMFPVFMSFAVIPFGPPIELWGRVIRLQILQIDVGVLFILAFGSIAVYGAMLAGWASNSKYALLGGMRASAQMISYEIILGIALIGPILVFGTMEPGAMVAQQNTLLFGWIPQWGIVVQPLAFLLFLPAALAEGQRSPFDLPEGESEIIGYFTEYSGMRWGMFFLGELSEMVVLAAVITTVFLGGYNIPYLYGAVEMAGQAGFHFPWGSYFALGDWTVVILRILTFGSKVAFLMWLQMQIRWTFPRFRYDQLMRVSWRELLPPALVNVAITGIVLLVF